MNKNKITLKRNDLIDLLERREQKYINLLINELDQEKRNEIKESIKKIQFLKEFIKDSKNNDELINFILKI